MGSCGLVTPVAGGVAEVGSVEIQVTLVLGASVVVSGFSSTTMNKQNEIQ